MNVNECQVVANAVLNKIDENLNAKVRPALMKDKDYIAWLKTEEEYNVLNKQLHALQQKRSNLQSKIQAKYNARIQKDHGYGVKTNEVTITHNDYRLQSQIYNTVILENIAGQDIYTMIDNLVDKFSK